MAEQQPLSGADLLSHIEERVEVLEPGTIQASRLYYQDPERVTAQLDHAFAQVKTDKDIPPCDEANYSHPMTSIDHKFDVVDGKEEK